MFAKALVEEVINDLSLYDEEKMREIAPRLINADAFCTRLPNDEDDDEATKKYYLRVPRGSILAKPAGESQSKDRHDKETLNVYYPFFSSHFCLPVKPGEHVWIFTAGEMSYWVSRVSEPNNVEDLNYTHNDRDFPPIQPPFFFAGKDYKDLPENKIERIPNFQNGKHFERRNNDKIEPSEDEMTVFKEAGGEASLKEYRDYELIYTDNYEASRIVYEAVPRLTKRPGDTILQGSNNTAIILGTERGFTPLTRPTADKTNADPLSDSSTILSNGMGAIDIIAGRGRIHPNGLADGESIYLAAPDGSIPPTADTTRPRVITNSRGLIETDKNIGIDAANVPYNVKDASEGDPDMLHDASRLYVAMKTAPDDLLGLTYPMTAAPGEANTATEIPTVTDAASIIVKSDEVRIVARWDEAHEINGSIKLIKEGNPDVDDGTGRAVIALQPDGTIMIDGPKIIIGSGISAAAALNGAGKQIALGVGATEPIVLGNVLKTKLEAFMDAVVAAFTFAATHTHPSGAGNTGGPISDKWAAEHANITTTKAELSETLSKIGKTL